MHTEIKLHGQTLWLLPQKALYWPANKTMIVADVHVGKAAHFRKNGIAMPIDAGQLEVSKLKELIQNYPVVHLVFLGDLFHAQANHEWQVLEAWLAQVPHISLTLVRGNHDIFLNDEEPLAGIKVCKDLLIDNFIFTHAPQPTVASNHYNLCGHIHPGVKLVGKGKQQLRLPCFHFTKNQGILPAFGSLTGAVALPTKGAEVFAVVAGNQVVRV